MKRQVNRILVAYCIKIPPKLVAAAGEVTHVLAVPARLPNIAARVCVLEHKPPLLGGEIDRRTEHRALQSGSVGHVVDLCMSGRTETAARAGGPFVGREGEFGVACRSAADDGRPGAGRVT